MQMAAILALPQVGSNLGDCRVGGRARGAGQGGGGRGAGAGGRTEMAARLALPQVFPTQASILVTCTDNSTSAYLLSCMQQTYH